MFIRTEEGYKIVSYCNDKETFYNAQTPDEVIRILEDARNKGLRVRLFYGELSTGRDWLEEYDTMGYIGRSTGSKRTPILLKTKRSRGGSAIHTANIVKITVEKRLLYTHPLYHTGILTLSDYDVEHDIFTHSVKRDGYVHARVQTHEEAERLRDFYLGKRNTR